MLALSNPCCTGENESAAWPVLSSAATADPADNVPLFTSKATNAPDPCWALTVTLKTGLEPGWKSSVTLTLPTPFGSTAVCVVAPLTVVAGVKDGTEFPEVPALDPKVQDPAVTSGVVAPPLLK